MKRGLWLVSLVCIPNIFHGEWLYVDGGPWVYDAASHHWMYILPFYHLSLDYNYRGQGQAELIFDAENPEFSDRWLYTGNLPYIYDAKGGIWTKCQGWPLKWACELIPDDQGGYDAIWISAFDPLGKDMVPEELTIETELSLSYFVQAFSIWLVSFDIYIRPVEQDGEVHLFASPKSELNRQQWTDDVGWTEETPARYEKLNETEAILELPDLGVKIHMDFQTYRRGLYTVYGPDDQVLSGPSSLPEDFGLNLAEFLYHP